jgi:membrane-bound lytic murein transglycosylase D
LKAHVSKKIRLKDHCRRPAVCVFIVCIFLFSGLDFPGYAQTPVKKSTPALEKRVLELEKEVSRLRNQVDVYDTDHLPDTLVLCNKKVPLTKDDIKERFEREFFQLLENRGLITILVKRYLKYQNMINEEIQKMSLPSDLIYLVIAESYLNPRALSKANAAGLWQFIKETAKREGLCVDDHVDERYNIKKATRSALGHLKKQYGEFGDWFIAMAAYNAGPNRLREAIENQETTDFFELFLPEETERYIFRILSIKEIINNREKYGIVIDEKSLYRPFSVGEVTIELSRETQTNIFSKAMDVPYRTFRELNLHIRRYKVSKGIYHLYVPYEKKSLFLQRLKSIPYIVVFGENQHVKDEP